MNTKLCPNCHNNIDANHKFCPICGTSLLDVPIQNVEAQVQPIGGSNVMTATKTKSKKAIVAWIITIIVAVLGVLAVLFLKDRFFPSKVKIAAKYVERIRSQLIVANSAKLAECVYFEVDCHDTDEIGRLDFYELAFTSGDDTRWIFVIDDEIFDQKNKLVFSSKKGEKREFSTEDLLKCVVAMTVYGYYMIGGNTTDYEILNMETIPIQKIADAM